MQRARSMLMFAAACAVLASAGAKAAAQGALDGLDAPPEVIAKLRAAMGGGDAGYPDPVDERGIPLVQYRWRYEVSSTGATIADSQIDLEGNLLMAANTSGSAILEKVNVSRLDAGSQVWRVTWNGFRVNDIVVDDDGSSYVALQPTGGGTAPAVAKVLPSGAIVWSSPTGIAGTQPPLALAVDPEGIPFAAGGNWVGRFDPNSGALAWQEPLNYTFLTGGDLVLPKILVDARNRINIAGTANAGGSGAQDVVLYRINGYTGERQAPIVYSQNVGTGKEVFFDLGRDFGDSVFIYFAYDVNTSGSATSGRLLKYSADGQMLWERGWSNFQFGGGAPSPQAGPGQGSPDLLIDRGGNAITSHDRVLNFTHSIRRWLPNGNLDYISPSNDFGGNGQGEWRYLPPGFNDFVNPFVHVQAKGVALDRLDQVYGVAYDELTFEMVLFKVQSDCACGPQSVWQTRRPIAAGATERAINGVLIDGGASLYVTGSYKSPGGDRLFIDKFTQPFVGVPTLQKAAAALQFENRSIWAPGAGNLVSQDEFFTVSWTDEGVDESGSVSIPLLGTFGGSFVFKTSGSLTGGYKAEVNGGTVDVHMPIEAKFLVPSSEKFGPGSPVVIPTDWAASEAARMTSCFTPTVNAGLTAGGNFSVRSSASATAFSAELFNIVFFNFGKIFPLAYIPGLNLLDLLAAAGLPVPGEWFEFNFYGGVFEGAFRTPVMMAQGRFNQATNEFTTSANDRFFNFGLNVTQAIMRSFGGTLQFEFEYPLPEQPQGGGSGGGSGGNDDDEEPDESDFGVRGSAEALQLVAKVNLAIQQDLKVKVDPPAVRYQFTDGIATRTVPLGTDLTFNLPSSWDGDLTITPYIAASAVFSNNTDVQFIPGIEWRTIAGGASLFAFGVDVLSLGPWCFLCYDWDLSEILGALGVQNASQYTNFSLNIFPLRAPTLPGQTPGPGLFPPSWTIPFPEVQLPDLRLVQSGPTQPRLLSASRSSMSMHIYDQTSPTVASFNVTANGKTRMLLYGTRFCNQATPSSPCDVAPQAYIVHHGRQEALPTTPINASTLLVEVPNRFRLLPGVAKLFVVANGRTTETIDMPIEYPTPRLDAVNPNLWAADPDLADLPISVIDAKTFRGNDTYIARRDYYVLMRNTLWNASTAGGDGAAAYFPGFNFNQLPGFPAVLWGGAQNGVPLPRFLQPVDNGIHNVRLADGNYDRPRSVAVTLCNPGPGGGFSNTINLTIAAPIPVVNAVTPPELAPSDVKSNEQGVLQPIELTIGGPKHVPNFTGYEEPKYGNFNADSVVRFNGTPLQTTFISSSMLKALLPPAMVTLGNHTITVHTPSNGTQYFEELWQDANMDGVRDPAPVFQGLVDSGGESVGFLFRVRYRQPDPSQLSPPTATVNSVAFSFPSTPDPKNPQGMNLSIRGVDFRPGAVVFFNNQPRLTTIVDQTLLRVRLLPQDVAAVGQFPVTVRNPAPDFQVSTPITFTVKPADAYRKYTTRTTGQTNVRGEKPQ